MKKHRISFDTTEWEGSCWGLVSLGMMAEKSYLDGMVVMGNGGSEVEIGITYVAVLSFFFWHPISTAGFC